MNWRSVMMAMMVIPLLICGLVLIFRSVESRAAKPLGLFLILAGCSMGPQIIGFAGAYQIWPWITFFPLFFVDLWLGPLLIIHADRLMRGGPLGWRRWLLLPGIIQSLYYLGAFLLPGDGLFDTPAKWAFNDAVHLPFIIPLESLMGVALIGLAIVLIWRQRKTYLGFLDRTESAARDYDPVWLRNLILALIIAGCVYVAIEVLTLIIPLSYVAAFPFLVLLTAILTWFGLDAAWRLTAPFPKMERVEVERAKTHDDPAPSELANRFMTELTREQWYLEPRLSIRDVAARLGTNESYVSRAVNGDLGGSFNTIVNQARIEHAKIRLSETDDSILAIAMDSGFNSKATFNRVFRSVTGLTPSQFRTQGPDSPS